MSISAVSAVVNYCLLGDGTSENKPYCRVDSTSYYYIDSCYRANCGDHLTAAKTACQAIWGTGYTGTPTFTSDGNAQTPTGSIKGTVYINAVSGTSVTDYSACPGCSQRFLSLSCTGCTENTKYCDSSGSLHICKSGRDTIFPRGLCSSDNKLKYSCSGGRVVETDCVAEWSNSVGAQCVVDDNYGAICTDCDADNDGYLDNLRSNACTPSGTVKDCAPNDPCIKGISNCDIDGDLWTNKNAFIKASASSTDACVTDTTLPSDCNDATNPSRCPSPGYTWGVCNAANASCPICQNPNAIEYCGNTIDENCDGVVLVCPTGQTCVNGACTTSGGGCTNDCTPSGKKICEGNAVKTCGSYDSDSCLDWSTPISCSAGQTCANGVCTGAGCTDDCTPSVKKICEVTAIKTCGSYDTDPCLDWSTTSCPSGQVCNSTVDCCTPKTCAQLGKECGTWPNGCDGSVTCKCPDGKTCITTTGECISSGGTRSVVMSANRTTAENIDGASKKIYFTGLGETAITRDGKSYLYLNREDKIKCTFTSNGATSASLVDEKENVYFAESVSGSGSGTHVFTGDMGEVYKKYINGSRVHCVITYIDGAKVSSDSAILIPWGIKESKSYTKKGVFIVSDSEWAQVLQAVPASVWDAADEDKDSTWCNSQNLSTKEGTEYKNRTKCIYPLLIYHKEGTTLSVPDSTSYMISDFTGDGEEEYVESIFNFIEDYKTDSIVSIEDSLGVARKMRAAKITLANKLWWQSQWVAKGIYVIASKNDYKGSLLASQLASHLNAPLMYVDSDNRAEWGSLLVGKVIVPVGTIDSSTLNSLNLKNLLISASESGLAYSENVPTNNLESVQKSLSIFTGNEEMILTNPKDIEKEYCEIPHKVLSQTFSELYCKMSMYSSYFAAANNYYNAFIEANPVPGPVEIELASEDAKSALENQVLEQNETVKELITAEFAKSFTPKFVLFLASPKSIANFAPVLVINVWEEEMATPMTNIIDKYYLSSTDDQGNEISADFTRVYTRSLAGLSSYIGRAIFMPFGGEP